MGCGPSSANKPNDSVVPPATPGGRPRSRSRAGPTPPASPLQPAGLQSFRNKNASRPPSAFGMAPDHAGGGGGVIPGTESRRNVLLRTKSMGPRIGGGGGGTNLASPTSPNPWSPSSPGTAGSASPMRAPSQLAPIKNAPGLRRVSTLRGGPSSATAAGPSFSVTVSAPPSDPSNPDGDTNASYPPMPCDVNNVHLATLYCDECDEAYCLSCDQIIHQRKKLRGHARRPLPLWGIASSNAGMAAAASAAAAAAAAAASQRPTLMSPANVGTSPTRSFTRTKSLFQPNTSSMTQSSSTPPSPIPGGHTLAVAPLPWSGSASLSAAHRSLPPSTSHSERSSPMTSPSTSRRKPLLNEKRKGDDSESKESPMSPAPPTTGQPVLLSPRKSGEKRQSDQQQSKFGRAATMGPRAAGNLKVPGLAVGANSTLTPALAASNAPTAGSGVLNMVPLEKLKDLGTEQLNVIWAQYDMDGNGVLDRRELKLLANDCIARTLQAIEDELRRTNPGISEKALKEAIERERIFALPGKKKEDTHKEMVKMLVRRLDVNGDGEVTKAELMMQWNSFSASLFQVRQQEALDCCIM